MRLLKYLLYLLVAASAMTLVRHFSQDSTESCWWMRVIECCFYLSPALAVWAVEKSRMKDFCKSYLLQFREMNVRMAVRYILLASFLYPLLIVLFVYVGGNLLGIDAVGRLVKVDENFTYMGISLVNASAWGGALVLLMNALFALCYGVTLGTLTYIAEEIGWRGFLEKNLSGRPQLRPLFVGLVWTLWATPFYLNSLSGSFASWLCLLFFNIAMSFYLSVVVKRTNSIWVSASIRGIISACSLSVVCPENGGIGYSCITILAVLCLWGVMMMQKIEKIH